jgi:hypothetical protein
LQSMDQTQFQGFSYTNPNATDWSGIHYVYLLGLISVLDHCQVVLPLRPTSSTQDSRQKLAHPHVALQLMLCSICIKTYSASHLRVAPDNVGLQKEQKCNTFACHTHNEVRLCVLGIRKKEVSNMKG